MINNFKFLKENVRAEAAACNPFLLLADGGVLSETRVRWLIPMVKYRVTD